MKSNTCNKIKNRKTAKDVFYTPRALAKEHIDYLNIPNDPSLKWLDPSKGKGAYYDQFPTDNKDWCEIADGKDFFQYNQPVSIIATNPPYSLIDKFIKKSIELKATTISFLIGLINITPRRIEIFEKAGYKMTALKILKVYEWFGMSAIVVFTKTQQAKSVMDYNRTVWRINPKKTQKNKPKKKKKLIFKIKKRSISNGKSTQ